MNLSKGIERRQRWRNYVGSTRRKKQQNQRGGLWPFSHPWSAHEKKNQCFITVYPLIYTHTHSQHTHIYICSFFPRKRRKEIWSDATISQEQTILGEIKLMTWTWTNLIIAIITKIRLEKLKPQVQSKLKLKVDNLNLNEAMVTIDVNQGILNPAPDKNYCWSRNPNDKF